MKVMKWIATVMILAAVILGVGYYILETHPTPVHLAKRTADNLGKVHSAEAEVEMDYEGTVTVFKNDVQIGMGTKFDMEAVTDPSASHTNGSLTISFMGFDVDVPVESYVQKENGEPVLYMNIANKTWTKQKVNDPANTMPEIDTRAVTALLIHKIISGEIKAELAEETEMICDKEAYKLSFDISGKTLEELLNAAAAYNENAAKLAESLDLSGTGAHIDMWIYKDMKLPARIAIDCTALGSYLVQSMLEEKGLVGTATKFTAVVTFTQYNTIEKIEVPEEVVGSAVEGGGNSILNGLIPGF